MTDIETKCIEYWPTGSHYICNPPVTDTDIDFIILVNEEWESIVDLIDKGWVKYGNGKYGNTDFVSLRKGKYNYIITSNEIFFNKFRAATELAKALNLKKKEDRIKLFDMVIEHHTNNKYADNEKQPSILGKYYKTKFVNVGVPIATTNL